MRAIIQRVAHAKVEVDGETTGAIHSGIMVLVGVQETDNQQTYQYMYDKIIHLRIFEDSDDKMNLSLQDINGELLIVPNFTLYGDCRKGRRPSYSTAAKPDIARRIFEEFCDFVQEKYHRVKKGVFQADMKVTLLNDGPVTLMVDSDKIF